MMRASQKIACLWCLVIEWTTVKTQGKIFIIFSSNFTLIRTAHTAKEAQQSIQDIKYKPDAIVLQLVTNVAKSNQPEIVNSDMKLVKNIKDKILTTKMLISEAPNKYSQTKLSTCISSINVSLADEFHGMDIRYNNINSIKSINRDGTIYTILCS